MGHRIEPLSQATLPDLLRFFEEVAFVDHPAWASCYCFFPHAPHATESWKERTGPQNRAGTCARVAAGTMGGLLAYDGDHVVGWCNAGDRAWVTMQGEFEASSRKMGAISCFVVAPDRRGQGIAAKLLAAASRKLKAEGCAVVEAYPYPDAKSAAEAHTGPLPMYEKAGFKEHSRDDDGSIVVRRDL